ncbi:MAG TPA: hypothetical protein VMU54_11565 [Planctomycetota bacterium]|nr:hypothetical protein [Planctomycetota bacterium]
MRVLLTGPAPMPQLPVHGILRDADPGPEVISAPLSPFVLEQVAQGGFDGVVCRSDGPEALQFVSRIRRQNQDVPSVVVSSMTDPGFETQALSTGASTVLPARADAAVIDGNLRRLMMLQGALRRFQENSRANDCLRAELREALIHRKSISQPGGHIHRISPSRGLLPRLVQEDPEATFQRVRALEQADVFAPLPVMQSVDEARGYLQGDPPHANRQIHRFPNVILLDLNPTVLGMELLRVDPLPEPEVRNSGHRPERDGRIPGHPGGLRQSREFLPGQTRGVRRTRQDGPLHRRQLDADQHRSDALA